MLAIFRAWGSKASPKLGFSARKRAKITVVHRACFHGLAVNGCMAVPPQVGAHFEARGSASCLRRNACAKVPSPHFRFLAGPGQKWAKTTRTHIPHQPLTKLGGPGGLMAAPLQARAHHEACGSASCLSPKACAKFKVAATTIQFFG